jgi:hypothetical protein
LTFRDLYVLVSFMFIAPISTENDAPGLEPAGVRLGWADFERASERLEMLRRLARLGMDLAQALRDRVVEAEGPPANGADPALSFTRVARAVRQSLALEARLEDDRRALSDRTEAAVAAARAEAIERAAEDLRQQVSARKKTVWTVLTPEIAAAASRDAGAERDDAGGSDDEAGYEEDDDEDDNDAYDALASALSERLADAVEREDFLMRPVEAIIAEIRAGLGLGAGDDEAADAVAFEAAARRAGSARKARAPLTCAEVRAAWGMVDGAVAGVESG